MFQLLVKPTQYVGGKTQDIINLILKQQTVNLIDTTDNDIYTINIVLTNNNLLESEQFKVRLNKNSNVIKSYNAITFSSKNKRFKTIADISTEIIKAKNREELPNCIISCCNAKRIKDFLYLLTIFGNDKDFILQNIKERTIIKFHFSFDEPDANLGVLNIFLKEIENFVNIVGILLITATPTDKFWKILQQNKIYELSNLNKNNVKDFLDKKEKYRSFNDHPFIIHDNNTNDTLKYIKEVFDKYIDPQDGLRIFAPGNNLIVSHNKIKEYFLEKGFVCLIINGTNKSFFYPDDNIEYTLENYKLHHFKENKDVEIKDILVHWHLNNQNKNLAITGYLSVERGLTLNTSGFNLTHTILSNYHLNNIGRAVQISGRCTGDKDYVEFIQIICTNLIKEKVNQFNNMIIDICSADIEFFNENDMSLDDNKGIPVKIEFIDEDYRINLFQENKNKKFHIILQNGIETNKIKVYDNNNLHKFDITKYKLKTVRRYKLGDKINARRFDKMNENFVICKGYVQDCTNFEYSIDIAENIWNHNNYINPVNIGWITFKY